MVAMEIFTVLFKSEAFILNSLNRVGRKYGVATPLVVMSCSVEVHPLRHGIRDICKMLHTWSKRDYHLQAKIS